MHRSLSAPQAGSLFLPSLDSAAPSQAPRDDDRGNGAKHRADDHTWPGQRQEERRPGTDGATNRVGRPVAKDTARGAGRERHHPTNGTSTQRIAEAEVFVSVSKVQGTPRGHNNSPGGACDGGKWETREQGWQRGLPVTVQSRPGGPARSGAKAKAGCRFPDLQEKGGKRADECR